VYAQGLCKDAKPTKRSYMDREFALFLFYKLTACKQAVFFIKETI